MTQRSAVFSAEATPHVAISDAVCASIAIPGVFRPRFIDGGGVITLAPVHYWDADIR
ncbi:patatin-like phospholipase family protein [Neorhizobium galegae]|uniref:patatin-like phospholipase family protein n=1 Tax=Neorhizobium galegae TaxID=399 RepID=UPI00358F1070